MLLPKQSTNLFASNYRNLSGAFMRQMLVEENFMKIVVIKSPKILRGILKLMFGIKKENA